MLRYFPITGRLYLSDDTQSPAHVIFDTDEPFLCVKPQDFKAGSQVVPSRTASSSGVDGTQTVVDIEKTYLLATIDIPGAKVVRGMMRSTWASNPEPADNLWRQASGTHLDILDGVSQTGKPQSDIAGYDRVATMGGYTFEVNGLNQLIMRERIVMRARDPGGPPTTFNRARQPATISFRLLIGFFLDQNFEPQPVADIVDYQGRVVPFDGAASQNFSCNFGPAFAGRRLVAFFHHMSSPTSATSCTIGGTAATLRGSIALGRFITQVWDATVSSGGSGTVTITRSGGWGAGTHFMGLELYGLGNITGAPTITSGTISSGTTPSCSVNVGASQIAVVSSVAANDGLVDSNYYINNWSNVGPRANFTEWTVNGGFGSGIVPTGTGAVTAAAVWSKSGDHKGIIAARYSM